MENQLTLHDAVFMGNIALVRKILKRDPLCVNDYNLDFNTPLHVVYDHIDVNNPKQANDRLEMMRLLLDNGADVNAKTGDSTDRSPLYMAVEKQQIEGVKLLLERKANPNIENWVGCKPLHIAVAKNSGREKIVRMLLEYGTNLSDITLCQSVDIKLLKIIVEAGGKLHDYFKDLSNAFILRDPELSQFLLDHGRELDGSGRFSLHNVLYCARLYVNIHPMIVKSWVLEFIIRMLVVQGFDFDAPQNENNTPLHIAVEQEDEDMVETLLKDGVNVNAKNIHDNTPLHSLLEKKRLSHNSKFHKIARLLIEYGAVNSRNCMNKTPICLAVQNDYPGIANMMFAKMTDIPITSLKCIEIPKISAFVSYMMFEPNSELFFAIHFNYEKVFDRLIDILPDVEKGGWLSLAINYQHYGIAKMLLEIGCQTAERLHIIIMSESNDNLKLLSLLKAYDNRSILNPLLIFELFNIEKYIRTPRKLTHLLTLCYAIDLCSNKKNTELIPIRGSFKSSHRLSPILRSCNKKLDELKTEKVCNVSVFTILSMEFDSLVNFLNREKNLAACVKLHSELTAEAELESYQYLLLVRLELAIEKRELLDSAKDSLTRVMERMLNKINIESLPDEIMWSILFKLTIRKLKKIANEL